MAKACDWLTFQHQKNLIGREINGKKHVIGRTPNIEESDWTRARARKHLIGSLFDQCYPEQTHNIF
jgi:hypothetical protein